MCKVTLANVATILSRYSGRIASLLHKARFIENQDPVRIAQIVRHHAVIGRNKPGLIPNDVADEMLHGTNLGILDIQGNGFNGFPLQLAHLSRHILGEGFSWLLTGKAIGKLGMKSSKLLNKLSNILFANEQLGNGEGPIRNSIFRYNGLTPPYAFAQYVS